MKTGFFKKIIYFCLSFLALVLSGGGVPVQADGFDRGLEATAAKAGYSGTLKNLGPDLVVQKVINFVLSWVGVLFLLLIIYGGIMWMTAQGNDQKMEKAKTVIIAAISGLVVVIAAYAISALVLGRFIIK